MPSSLPYRPTECHPPIDPEIAAILAMPGSPPASVRPADIPAARQRSKANALTDDQCARGGAIAVSDIVLRGPSDHPDVPALLLRPAIPLPHPATPGPAVLFIHGGGMIMGTRRNIEGTMLDLVQRGVTVISPEYRLAPENPYPAAIDDLVAAWQDVISQAGSLQIDPARTAIAGTSAGGGLAAGVTLRLRDEDVTMPSHQILFCPMLDDRDITASSTELDAVACWDRVANKTGWSAYLDGTNGYDDIPVYAAPAREPDLRGLPPTFIDVGEVDTFRDEDLDYAARLARAGIPVEFHLWPGAVHGFTGSAPETAVAKAAESARQHYFSRTLVH